MRLAPCGAAECGGEHEQAAHQQGCRRRQCTGGASAADCRGGGRAIRAGCVRGSAKAKLPNQPAGAHCPMLAALHGNGAACTVDHVCSHCCPRSRQGVQGSADTLAAAGHASSHPSGARGTGHQVPLPADPWTWRMPPVHSAGRQRRPSSSRGARRAPQPATQPACCVQLALLGRGPAPAELAAGPPAGRAPSAPPSWLLAERAGSGAAACCRPLALREGAWGCPGWAGGQRRGPAVR